jgi:putative acyl-CoA dehydrogenase
MERWQTHRVDNQFDELDDYNLFATDTALRDAVAAAGAGWAVPQLDDYGKRIGSAESFRLAAEANRHTPELHAFDRRGRRVDRVEFHPSWHALMAGFRATGWISLPFRDERAGRWVADIAGMYLHAQVESGSSCPATMTWASIPLLQREGALWAKCGDKLFSDR